MKRAVWAVPVILGMVLVSNLWAFGGRQAGTGCNGSGCGGNCTAAAVTCSGPIEELTGMVVGYGSPERGIVIETEQGTQTLYGLGPFWYWEKAGLDKPEPGELVTVTATNAVSGGKTVKVILSLSIGEETIALRDEATCQPLWRGKR